VTTSHSISTITTTRLWFHSASSSKTLYHSDW